MNELGGAKDEHKNTARKPTDDRKDFLEFPIHGDSGSTAPLLGRLKLQLLFEASAKRFRSGRGTVLSPRYLSGLPNLLFQRKLPTLEVGFSTLHAISRR